MSMRCKEGDLAIVIQIDGGHPGNLWKVVKCLSFHGKFHCVTTGNGLEDCWRVSTDNLLTVSGRPGKEVADYVLHPDAWLLPIRDPDQKTLKINLKDNPISQRLIEDLQRLF